MPNPYALMPQVVNQRRPQILYGQVSTHMPAPTSFTDPLYVTIPQWRADYYWTITDWPACHGSTLPAQGADCVVYFDDQRTMRCVWWDGAYEPAAGGATYISQVTAANINAVISGMTSPKTGIVIELPAGDFDLSGTTINASSTYNVTIRGQGSAYGGTRIKTFNTSGALINGQQSHGFRLEGLALWASSSTFSDFLLDLGTPAIGTTGGQLFRIRDCNFTCAANGSITNHMVSLNNALSGQITGCYFIGGGQAIHGAENSSYFCNANVIGPANYFQQQTSASVADLTESNSIVDNAFEPLYSGAPGAYFQDNSIPSTALRFSRNYCGDGTATGNFAVIYGDGTEIEGNYFQTSSSSTSAVAVATNGNCNGLKIMGNAFLGLQNALNPATGSHTRVVYLANRESSVTSPIGTLTTLGAGSFVDSSGTLYAKGGITSF